MQTNVNIDEWRGAKAVDVNGDKVGSIDEVYLDRGTEKPEWVTVSTGLFGTRTTFVPIGDAQLNDGEVRLGYAKDQIKDAPNVDADGALSREEEQALYEHYGRSDYGDWNGSDTRTGDGVTGRDSTDRDLSDRDRTDRETTGHDTSGPTTDDAMTRSEEELRVGTTERESGRVRLQKYVVEEEVTKTVPVRREEVRVEREPITDANRDDAHDGPAISEEEHEVVLHSEEAVVDKRAVPKERIRLEKDVTTDEETISETVRKEQVDVDGDRDRDRDRR
jgi:uncharacterized protein (TIGR02271 family)